MNMAVNIAGVEWKNPVTTASGTFGPRQDPRGCSARPAAQ